MSKNLIDPSRISYTGILSDLDAFLAGQDDAAKWKDYFDFATGTTVKELCASLGAFLRFHSMSLLRERSLLTAKLQSTILNIAYHLDYPVNRASAMMVTLTVNVTKAGYFLRDQPLCYVDSQPLSLPESRYLPLGNQKINLLVGEWETTTSVVDADTEFYTFVVPIENVMTVDNTNIQVKVGDTVVQTSRYTDDMYDGALAISTLPDALALKSGDISIGVRLPYNADVEIQYLRVVDTTSLADFQLDITKINMESGFMTPQLIEVHTPFYPADSLAKIAALAPGYHSTQRRMVTPSDHEHLVKSYPGIIDASFHRGECSVDDKWNQAECEAVPGAVWDDGRQEGCCRCAMSYLFSDEHALSPLEELTLLDYLAKFKISAEGIVWIDPQPVAVDLELLLVVDKTAEIGSMEESIKAQANTMCYKLGGTFYLGGLTRNLEKVTRVYVKRPMTDKKLRYYQYFFVRSLNVTFTTDTTELANFGDISNPDSGYTLMNAGG